jgi:hypothetical protein
VLVAQLKLVVDAHTHLLFHIFYPLALSCIRQAVESQVLLLTLQAVAYQIWNNYGGANLPEVLNTAYALLRARQIPV